MIVNKVLHPKESLNKYINKNHVEVLSGLNELQKENIVELVGVSGNLGLMSYIVFYEDKGICTCPGCGHDISNTFSFCPNCGRKLK